MGKDFDCDIKKKGLNVKGESKKKHVEEGEPNQIKV